MTNVFLVRMEEMKYFIFLFIDLIPSCKMAMEPIQFRINGYNCPIEISKTKIVMRWAQTFIKN